MISKVLLLIALAGSVVCAARYNYPGSQYSIPEPLVRVFRPEGFSVSIPDSPGIQLFAFHANINKPLVALEAGRFSRDILRAEGGAWRFTDSETRLVRGDTIYFWLYVIKDDLGYRLDRGIFHVKDIEDESIPDSVPDVNPDLTQSQKNVSNVDTEVVTHPTQEKDTFSSRICQDTLLNVSRALVNLQTSHQSLSNRNDILREIIQKYPEASKSLTLEGKFPNDDDPVLFVREILRQKLHTTIKPLSARKNGSDKIVFEVNTLDDKIAILEAAKEKLSNSKFQISS